MRIISLDKFGIHNQIIGGLNEAQDSIHIRQFEHILSKKPLQIRLVKESMSILVSGTEITKLNATFDDKNSTDVQKLLSKNMKMGIKDKRLCLLCFNIPVLTLTIEPDSKTKKFSVIIKKA